MSPLLHPITRKSGVRWGPRLRGLRSFGLLNPQLAQWANVISGLRRWYVATRICGSRNHQVRSLEAHNKSARDYDIVLASAGPHHIQLRLS